MKKKKQDKQCLGDKWAEKVDNNYSEIKFQPTQSQTCRFKDKIEIGQKSEEVNNYYAGKIMEMNSFQYDTKSLKIKNI